MRRIGPARVRTVRASVKPLIPQECQAPVYHTSTKINAERAGFAAILCRAGSSAEK